MRQLAVVGGLMTGAAGLAAACSPAAPQSPAAAPAKSAEGAKPVTAESAKSVAPAPKGQQPSGSVVIIVPEDARQLGADAAYSSWGYVQLRNVQEALINRDPTSNQLVGELATKWERTNPTTWRFDLRKGVKFHDGSPFNAESAAFGLNHVWSRDNKFEIRAFIGPELKAQAVDEHTLDVVTESPDPILPSRLYFSPIPSMKALKETPDLYPVHPVGTGPYRFVEWIKGQHVKLEANPDWWGRAAPEEARGAATIKDVTIAVRAEREVRTAMIKRGEGDLARWITNEQCKDAPNCATGPAVETVFVRLDAGDHPALKDKRIREAIALAIDKNVIINELIGGGSPARQLVGPSALGYNPELQPYPYDPARAKQLVAEAKAAGVPIDAELNVMARRAYITRVDEITEAVADMLKQVGFTNIKVQVPETATFQDILIAKPVLPERGMVAIHMHGNELMDYAATVNSYYMTDGKNSVFTNPKIDELHKKGLEQSGAEREKTYQEIARLAHEDMYIIPIGHPDFFFGLSNRLEWKSRMDGFILVKEMTLKA